MSRCAAVLGAALLLPAPAFGQAIPATIAGTVGDAATFGRVITTSQSTGMPGDARVVQFVAKFIS